MTAIGAVSINKVLALMTMNDSMDGKAFAVFIEKSLCPQLWVGAVVVMDNLPAHKLASIEPMIQSVGASVICLSPYSPDFNPIELWWSQLKSFLQMFAPTTTSMVDKLIAVTLQLINPQHLRNWESSLLLLYLITAGTAVSFPEPLRQRQENKIKQVMREFGVY